MRNFSGSVPGQKILFPPGFLSCQVINILAMFHPFKCKPCHSRNMIMCLSLAEFDAFQGGLLSPAMGTQGLAFTLGKAECQNGIYMMHMDFSLGYGKFQLHQPPWKDWAWWSVPDEDWWVWHDHVHWRDGKPGLGARSHHRTRKACSHLDRK